MAERRQKEDCRALFVILTSSTNSSVIVRWCEYNRSFNLLLHEIFDTLRVERNQNIASRLMELAGNDFDECYENNAAFNDSITLLLALCKKYRWTFSNSVTPPDSPGREQFGGGGGGGDNANGGNGHQEAAEAI